VTPGKNATTWTNPEGLSVSLQKHGAVGRTCCAAFPFVFLPGLVVGGGGGGTSGNVLLLKATLE
jgi:hypothetical protein